MKNKKQAICLNILLVILEVIGLVFTLKAMKLTEVVKYYTELSNILALVASIVLLYFLFKGNKIPKSVSILKFISVVSLTVTFLVVLFVLGPMYEFNYRWLLFSGDMTFTHLLCPIIAFISFVFFEEYKFDKSDCLKANALTFGYAIVMIILNLCDVVDGPYPFLRIKHQNIFISLIWIVTIVGGSYLLSLGINELKKRVK